MSKKEALVEHPSPLYAWTIFLLSVLFNAYSGTLQFSPSVENIIGQEIPKITITVYALSGFYYTFAIFQIPVGILIDRYGARVFPSLGILLCGIGAILMSQSQTNMAMTLSRAVMGIGAAFSFLNGLKIMNNWFQPKRFAYLLGLFIALGSLGIVLRKSGFNVLEEMFQWRMAMMVFGLGGLIFACVYFFVVQDAPGAGFSIHSPIKDKKEFWANVKEVFNNSHPWVIGIAVGLVIGPLFAFETVWSIPFIKVAYHLNTQMAVMFSILFVFGYGAGAVFFGRVSTSIGQRKLFIPWGIGIAILMLLIILYPPYLGIQITAVCFFILGFAASNVNLGYVLIHEHNVPHMTATSAAVVNTFYAFFAAISQSLIAVFLNLGLAEEHTKSFSVHDFQVSLVRLPVYMLIALVFSFFIKETFCHQRHSYED